MRHPIEANQKRHPIHLPPLPGFLTFCPRVNPTVGENIGANGSTGERNTIQFDEIAPHTSIGSSTTTLKVAHGEQTNVKGAGFN